MNRAILDLHGLTEREATSQVMSSLVNLEYELEIITGKGEVLQRVVEEILEDEGYDWYHERGNTGSYIVKPY